MKKSGYEIYQFGYEFFVVLFLVILQNGLNQILLKRCGNTSRVGLINQMNNFRNQSIIGGITIELAKISLRLDKLDNTLPCYSFTLQISYKK